MYTVAIGRVEYNSNNIFGKHFADAASFSTYEKAFDYMKAKYQQMLNEWKDKPLNEPKFTKDLAAISAVYKDNETTFTDVWVAEIIEQAEVL